ncbi:hypothetical protein ACFQ3Z_06880 [Streptomyces nogalater]
MSLGAGLPFARPARSALTLAAVVLGVTTVTFATGLAATLNSFGDGGDRTYDVTVYVGTHHNGKEVRRRAATVNSRRCWPPCRARVTSRRGRTTRCSSWAVRTW